MMKAAKAIYSLCVEDNIVFLWNMQSKWGDWDMTNSLILTKLPFGGKAEYPRERHCEKRDEECISSMGKIRQI